MCASPITVLCCYLETSRVYWSWSEYTQVVWKLSLDYFVSFFLQIEFSLFHVLLLSK